jgi:hypothetical protein
MRLYIKTYHFIPSQIKTMVSFKKKFDTEMVHMNHMWIALIHQFIDTRNINEAVGKTMMELVQSGTPISNIAIFIRIHHKINVDYATIEK